MESVSGDRYVTLQPNPTAYIWFLNASHKVAGETNPQKLYSEHHTCATACTHPYNFYIKKPGRVV